MTAPVEWRRRLLGHARSACALDDPWGVAACALELEACARSGDWIANLTDATAVSAPLRARGTQAVGQVERIAVGAVRWAGERRPGDADEAFHELRGSIAELLAADPDIDLSRPRYRWRIPWTGDGLAAFHARLAPLFAQVPEVRADVPDLDAAMRRCIAAAGDVGARDAPPDETGLGASISAARAMSHSMLERDAAWPSPLRASHARWFDAALSSARSWVDVDVASFHASAVLAIEHAWLHALVATASWPLRAALLAHAEPSFAPNIAPARDIAIELTGEPDPTRLPWIRTLWERNFVTHSEGSHVGEAGFELLSAWRASQATPELAARVAATDLAPIARRIHLWDREVAVADADRLLAGEVERPLPVRW